MSIIPHNSLRTALEDGLKMEQPCPRCDGQLREKNGFTVCEHCQVTPNGVFVPRPVDPPDGPTKDENRERYRVSGRYKMMGGFEEAYPNEMTRTEDSLI